MTSPSPTPPLPPSRSDAAHADRADHASLNALSQRLYEDLRNLAAAQLKAERPDHTLQPTALVHEAYLRLAAQHNHIADRSHFIALASGMMRRILVDHARARNADKRGGGDGGRTQVTLSEIDGAVGPRSPTNSGRDVDLLALDSALEKLAAIAPEQAKIVELRFFGGLNVEDTAAILGIGKRSVDREWALAKAWLFRALGGSAAR